MAARRHVTNKLRTAYGKAGTAGAERRGWLLCVVAVEVSRQRYRARDGGIEVRVDASDAAGRSARHQSGVEVSEFTRRVEARPDEGSGVA